MNAPDGRSRNHQVPCRFENPAGAERLPESDIELPPRRGAANQAGHDHAVSHILYYPMSRAPASALERIFQVSVIESRSHAVHLRLPQPHAGRRLTPA